MTSVVLSSAYLPPIEYFAYIIHADRVYIEQWDNYQKQSYRNRCSIITANGVMPLSIPVIKHSNTKTPTKDIKIDYQKNWQHLHWNALVSSYGSSPFFEYYADELHPFYCKKYEFLFDFNEQLLHLVSSWLGLDNKKLLLTTQYHQNLPEETIDLREVIHPKRGRKTSVHPDYYQVFMPKLGFIPNQSIVDLIFNMGNESLLILHHCMLHSS